MLVLELEMNELLLEVDAQERHSKQAHKSLYHVIAPPVPLMV